MVSSEIPSGGEESAAFVAIIVSDAFRVVVLQLLRLAEKQIAFSAVPVRMFVGVVFLEKTDFREKPPAGLAVVMSRASVVVVQ